MDKIIEQNELLLEENEFLKSSLDKLNKGGATANASQELATLRGEVASWKLAFESSVSQLAELKAANTKLSEGMHESETKIATLTDALYDAEQKIEAVTHNNNDLSIEARKLQSSSEVSGAASTSELLKVRDELAKAMEEREVMSGMSRVLVMEKVRAEGLAKDGADAAKALREIRAKMPRVQECAAEIKKCGSAEATSARGTATVDQRLDVVIDAVAYEFKVKAPPAGANTTAKEVIELFGALLIDVAKLQKVVAKV